MDQTKKKKFLIIKNMDQTNENNQTESKYLRNLREHLKLKYTNSLSLFQNFLPNQIEYYSQIKNN